MLRAVYCERPHRPLERRDLNPHPNSKLHSEQQKGRCLSRAHALDCHLKHTSGIGNKTDSKQSTIKQRTFHFAASLSAEGALLERSYIRMNELFCL
ncbi:Hypothetical predicted protein [Pelobates cultripes]|uniref:Uncharacterized protein n=1 Tax=Pelobates cultripes TaxID=61616 RepID=A0AAD1RT14_PELCU|nr:Hypothetical predicted protein [Pelobates cultripes]